MKYKEHKKKQANYMLNTYAWKIMREDVNWKARIKECFDNNIFTNASLSEIMQIIYNFVAMCVLIPFEVGKLLAVPFRIVLLPITVYIKIVKARKYWANYLKDTK